MSAQATPVEPIIFLSTRTEAIEASKVRMTLRNMAGQGVLHLAVERTAIVWDVRHHVAIQMGLTSNQIHLVLDWNELNDLDRIYTIQPLLEAKGNVIDLLVDIQELPPLCFDCPNCGRECNLSECVEWSDDPSERCSHTSHYCCYGQFNAAT
jgi:hypothetical protein